MKTELGEHFASCGDAKMELFDYIEVLYTNGVAIPRSASSVRRRSSGVLKRPTQRN